MNRDELISGLAALSDGEFVDLFYKVVAARPHPNDMPEDIEQSRWVLAVAHRVIERPWKGWTLMMQCPAKKFNADNPLFVCEAGKHCGYETCCTEKVGICPICGQEVHGT